MPMRNGFYLVIVTLLLSAPMALGQAGSSRDLRADEQQLQRFRWQLQQDQSRLSFDRHHHTSHSLILEDETRVRRDRQANRVLRADMRGNRRIRHRRYASL